jgi:hypothetical protein
MLLKSSPTTATANTRVSPSKDKPGFFIKSQQTQEKQQKKVRKQTQTGKTTHTDTQEGRRQMNQSERASERARSDK